MSGHAAAAGLAALALTGALAGCGSPAPDLFVVQRSGADPAANVRMVVSDGGSVTCNGRSHVLPPKQLLAARELTRDLEPQARLDLTLPPGPNSVLAYRARMEAGTIAFADTSRHLPPSFQRLAVFTKDVTEDVCGIAR